MNIAPTPVAKSMAELLQEVGQGDYNDFRRYLNENSIVNLDFSATSHRDRAVPLALVAAMMSYLDIFYNKELYGNPRHSFLINHYDFHVLFLFIPLVCTTFSSIFVETIDSLKPHMFPINFNMNDLFQALHGSKVKSVNLSNNRIVDERVRDIAANLQGTLVEELDLSGNYISDAGARDLIHNLHGTSVRALNLSRCRISSEGAKYLLANLPSQLISLGLEGNLGLSFTWKHDFAGLVAKTDLIDNLEAKSGCLAYGQQKLVNKLCWHGDYAEAIKLNQQKKLMAPLEWARLRHLSEDKKAPFLNQNLEYPKNEKQEALYAGGILMRSDLPEEVFAKVLSYMPLMRGRNGQSQADTYLRLAEQKHWSMHEGKAIEQDLSERESLERSWCTIS